MTERPAEGPILVTGGSGQVALALEAAALRRGVPVRRVGRPTFDFDHPDSVGRVVKDVVPSAVVNAAAFTAVDAAESEPEAAFRANRDGPGILARLCAEAGVPLLHLSTDYVFDGGKGAPYVETDRPNPQGVYGASKLAGEAAVLAACPGALVLRTSWVYSPTGKNFVRTMLNAARTNKRLRVVADQKGCPTAAFDIADAILGILADPRPRIGLVSGGGIHHMAGAGWTTWHGLATALFERAAEHGMAVSEVEAIATADWPTPARRPADSRLDCGKLADRFGIRLPAWRESLNFTVDAILAATKKGEIRHAPV